MYCSVERIKKIAEAVLRDEHDGLEVVFAISVDRTLTEAGVREQISTRLHSGLRQRLFQS
jgi:hypothetical protein